MCYYKIHRKNVLMIKTYKLMQYLSPSLVLNFLECATLPVFISFAHILIKSA